MRNICNLGRKAGRVPMEFGPTELDADCPIPLEDLGELYRSDAATLSALLAKMPEDARGRVALFCYGRSHLRALGLTIAATCNEKRVAYLAGALGSVLAAQCRAKLRDSFGQDPSHFSRPKAKISLAGSRL
jgi:hypothetical protein